jgi:hypothetical protein
MAFSSAELATIANAAIDYHFKGQPLPQSIQDKPLLSAMEANRKTFPGGKGDITIPVKGDYTFDSAGPDGSLTGYTHDDQVLFGNFAGIERVRYTWRETHTGWSVTHTELKIDGISINDSARGMANTKHSGREMTAITNLMQDKVETFAEVTERSLNDMFYGDGSGDALGFLGIQYYITKTPSVGVTGGLNRANYTWWRNRYQSWDPASIELPEVIHSEMRQLRRFGGRPSLVVAGSDFLDALVTQLREKGQYTNSNWSRPQATDIEVADVRYGNIVFKYDPTMDDLGMEKECFAIDPRRLYVYAMEGEWGKDHTPTRPHDVYASFTSRTFTGQLVANQLNCHARWEIV